MKEKKDYLTVKEFAEAAGISKQAVYSQLDSRLKEFVKVIDKQKMISVAALDKFYDNQVDRKIKSSFNQVEQSDLTAAEAMRTALEALEKQLEAKDRQLEAKDKQIESLTKLLDQQQQLNLVSIQDKQEEVPTIEDTKENKTQKKKGFFRRRNKNEA